MDSTQKVLIENKCGFSVEGSKQKNFVLFQESYTDLMELENKLSIPIKYKIVAEIMLVINDLFIFMN